MIRAVYDLCCRNPATHASAGIFSLSLIQHGRLISCPHSSLFLLLYLFFFFSLFISISSLSSLSLPTSLSVTPFLSISISSCLYFFLFLPLSLFLYLYIHLFPSFPFPPFSLPFPPCLSLSSSPSTWVSHCHFPSLLICLAHHSMRCFLLSYLFFSIYLTSHTSTLQSSRNSIFLYLLSRNIIVVINNRITIKNFLQLPFSSTPF